MSEALEAPEASELPERPEASDVREPAGVHAPSEAARRRQSIVLAVCCLSVLLVSLDTTILNVALPAIQRDLDSSVSGLQWTLDAYTIVLASLLTLAGSTADRVGRRRIFRLGLLVFTGGSLLCSLAPTLGWVVVFRMVHALGGCMLTPVAMAILTNSSPSPASEHARSAYPRDPVMVADWVSFNVIDTEKQDWARGWAALKKFTELHARVPYGHKEGAYPLGQWVAEQRRAYGAGQMSGLRARRLEKLGMVWSLADERFQENLEAAKAYYEQHWTLCAPRSATALDRPVGQWLSNLRRPGALEGHPEWKTALEAVDEDWSPEWHQPGACIPRILRGLGVLPRAVPDGAVGE